MTTQDGEKLTPILRGTTAPASWNRTSIDRSKAIRTVPMKVLSLGFPRTGTMSTSTALSLLGFNDVYHMVSVFENPKDCDMWIRAAKARNGEGKFTKRDWDALLGHCQAVTDFPPSAFADELIEAYPDAKVILHIRPTEKWYASAKSTILSFGDLSAVPLLARPFVMLVGFVVSKWGPLLSKMGPMQTSIRLMTTHGDSSPSAFRTAYETHNAHVQSLVPPSHLLLWGPQDGWAPLCAFLGVPIPEVPLPYINETASFKEIVKGLFDRDLRDIGRMVLGRVLRVGVVGLGLVGVGRYLGVGGVVKGYLPAMRYPF